MAGNDFPGNSSGRGGFGLKTVGVYALITVVTVLAIVGLTVPWNHVKPPITMFMGKSWIENLTYTATLNRNGSLDVTEEWDMRFKDRGTPWQGVYKTFNLVGEEALEDFHAWDGDQEMDMPEWSSDDSGSLSVRKTSTQTMYFNDPIPSGGKSVRLSYRITNIASAIKDGALLDWMPIDETNTLPVAHLKGTIEWLDATSDDGWSAVAATTGRTSSRTTRTGMSFAVDGLRDESALSIITLAPSSVLNKRTPANLTSWDIRQRAMLREISPALRDSFNEGMLRFTVSLWLLALLVCVITQAWVFRFLRSKPLSSWRDKPKIEPIVAARIVNAMKWDPTHYGNEYSTALMACISKGVVIIDDAGLVEMEYATGWDDLTALEAKFARLFNKMVEKAQSGHQQRRTLKRVSMMKPRKDTALSLDTEIKFTAEEFGSWIWVNKVITVCSYTICCLMWMQQVSLNVNNVVSMINAIALAIVLIMIGKQKIAKETRASVAGGLLAITFIATGPVFALIAALALSAKVISTLTPTFTPHRKYAAEINHLRSLRSYLLDGASFRQRGIKDVLQWDWYMVYATAFGIQTQVSDRMESFIQAAGNKLSENQISHLQSLGVDTSSSIERPDFSFDVSQFGSTLNTTMAGYHSHEYFGGSSSGGGGGGGGGGGSSGGSSGGGGMGAF